MSTRLFLGFNAWLLLTLGVALTACGPSSYLAVQPLEQKAEAVNGPQTLFAELDGVETELTFSHFRIKDAVYQAEIRNGSSEAVVVDPATFYYQLRRAQGASSTSDTSSFLPPVSAYDPEAEVQPLSTRLRIENDAVMGVTELEWMVIMANVTQEAVAKRRREMQRVRNSQPGSTTAKGQAEQSDITVLTAQELELWQGALLRRYNLQPGELIRGYVVFPGHNQSAVMRITTPVGPHIFTFDYSQKQLRY